EGYLRYRSGDRSAVSRVSMTDYAVRGLEGAWVPVAANVSGQELRVRELRVKYLVLDGRDYSIIDQTNQIVDRGEYLVDDTSSPQAIDIVGRDGPNAGRSMLAIFELIGDRLTVCYDLDG